jgi:hypothetical protein
MGMNTPLRRVVLTVTGLLGLYVGLWAEFFPRAFYLSFPGAGLHWISLSGAYDEHLIRDVGSFYLALTAISIAGIIARTALPCRIAGLGWTVFGVPHFVYHVTHLAGSVTDKAGNIVGLGISVILGIILLFPPRSSAFWKESP